MARGRLWPLNFAKNDYALITTYYRQSTTPYLLQTIGRKLTGYGNRPAILLRVPLRCSASPRLH